MLLCIETQSMHMMKEGHCYFSFARIAIPSLHHVYKNINIIRKQNNEKNKHKRCNLLWERKKIVIHWCSRAIVNKKEGDVTSCVEIFNIVNTNLIRFAEIFKNRRNVTASMVFKGYVNFAMKISKHFEYKWRPPKSLVEPIWGSNYVELRKVGTWGALLTSSTKRG